MKSELVGDLVPVEELVQLQIIPLTFSTAEYVVESLDIDLEAQTVLRTFQE